MPTHKVGYLIGSFAKASINRQLAGLNTENGGVTNESTAEFLRNYMSDSTNASRVLAVLPRTHDHLYQLADPVASEKYQLHTLPSDDVGPWIVRVQARGHSAATSLRLDAPRCGMPCFRRKLGGLLSQQSP